MAEENKVIHDAVPLKDDNINTNDNRECGDWITRYPIEAKKKQRIEAIYLVCCFIVSLLMLSINYLGIFEQILLYYNIDESRIVIFTKIITCIFAGMFGGVIFDIKWFYRAIARGYWNEDRIYWRIFLPLVSMAFAFSLACILSSNVIADSNGFATVTIGFLAGYFSDEAAGKMAEVAHVLFNTNSKKKE